MRNKTGHIVNKMLWDGIDSFQSANNWWSERIVRLKLIKFIFFHFVGCCHCLTLTTCSTRLSCAYSFCCSINFFFVLLRGSWSVEQANSIHIWFIDNSSKLPLQRKVYNSKFTTTSKKFMTRQALSHPSNSAVYILDIERWKKKKLFHAVAIRVSVVLIATIK